MQSTLSTEPETWSATLGAQDQILESQISSSRQPRTLSTESLTRTRQGSWASPVPSPQLRPGGMWALHKCNPFSRPLSRVCPVPIGLQAEVEPSCKYSEPPSRALGSQFVQHSLWFQHAILSCPRIILHSIHKAPVEFFHGGLHQPALDSKTAILKVLIARIGTLICAALCAIFNFQWKVRVPSEAVLLPIVVLSMARFVKVK